jgi:hypothetical protein
MSPNAMRGVRLLVHACAYACSALATACLGAGEVERAGYSPNLRPEHAAIEPVEADERMRKRIDSKDNVDGMQVPLRSAFADGHDIRYFDFGALDAMAAPKPLWRFRRRGVDGTPEDFGHLDLVDSAPGDTGYSPLRALYQVIVTPAYAGERITSFDALEDALEIGLVEEPVALGSYAACPILLADTALEANEGAPPPLATRQLYYRGHVASCVGVVNEAGDGTLAFDERGMVPSASAYALRRQNENRALDETLWQADLNQDGDTRDSNLVLALRPGAVAYRMYDVTVPPVYTFGASRAESDLFERQMLGLHALDGRVIAYADSGTQRLLIAWSDPP